MSSSLDFAPISVHLTALSQCGQMTEISYLKPPATQIRHRPRTNAIYSRPCYPNSEEINPKCDHFRVRPPRCTARRDETEVGGGRAGERMTTEDDGIILDTFLHALYFLARRARFRLEPISLGLMPGKTKVVGSVPYSLHAEMQKKVTCPGTLL